MREDMPDMPHQLSAIFRQLGAVCMGKTRHLSRRHFANISQRVMSARIRAYEEGGLKE
jgi:hypothetical protein